MKDFVACGKNGCVNGWLIDDINGMSKHCECRKGYDTEAMLLDAGIPADYIGKTLDGFNPKNEWESGHVADFKNYVDSFSERLIDGKGFFLFGKTKRIGKTHCAVAMARDILLKNYNIKAPVQWVYYVNVSELFEMLWTKISIEKGNNPSGNPELARMNGVIDKIKTCKLLILDDIGVTRKTDFVTNTLYTMVEYRTANNLPIIATSNCTLAQINLAYGEDGERIAKRLKEKVRAKEFYGNGGK